MVNQRVCGSLETSDDEKQGVLCSRAKDQTRDDLSALIYARLAEEIGNDLRFRLKRLKACKKHCWAFYVAPGHSIRSTLEQRVMSQTGRSPHP